MKAEKADPEEDSIVSELPVYLAKSLANQLYVLQYPIRPHTHTYDDAPINKTLVRPKLGQIEIEMGLHTRGPTYDKSKGEQIALNVDGAYRDKRDSEDNFYKSNVMDKMVLCSSKEVTDASRYAVGLVHENALHLTPLSCILAMRPSFAYLDQADKRVRSEHKENSDGETEDSDDEDKAKKVTVRFEKPETDRSKKAKEKSYNYLQKQLREEPWIDVSYNKFGSERSEFESRKLFCQHEDEIVDQFTLSPLEYLIQLVPPPQSVEITTPGLPAHLMSRVALMALPLHDRVKTVISNAGVASFTELLGLVGGNQSADSALAVLKVLQQVAVLVQGNWVVKSDIIYPRESVSQSGVANELIHRARDYVLYLFTKSTNVTRTEVAEVVGLPGPDVKEILHGVATCRGNRNTWEFLLPTDIGFLKKYADVVQRQQMIWQSRNEQLSQTFKDKQNKHDESVKVSSVPAPAKKARGAKTDSKTEEVVKQVQPASGKTKQRVARK